MMEPTGGGLARSLLSLKPVPILNLVWSGKHAFATQSFYLLQLDLQLSFILKNLLRNLKSKRGGVVIKPRLCLHLPLSKPSCFLWHIKYSKFQLQPSVMWWKFFWQCLQFCQHLLPSELFLQSKKKGEGNYDKTPPVDARITGSYWAVFSCPKTFAPHLFSCSPTNLRSRYFP